VLAPPGGGKGTASNMLAAITGQITICISDLLKGDARAQSYMRKRLYAPDSLIFEHLDGRLKNLSPGSSIIIDGIRTRSQAQWLLNELWDKFDQIGRVTTVFVDTDIDVAIRRQIERYEEELKLPEEQRQRVEKPDPEVIRTGIEEYQKNIYPLRLHLWKYTRASELDNNCPLESLRFKCRRFVEEEADRLEDTRPTTPEPQTLAQGVSITT